MVTCATGGAFLPGRLITQLRQVPTLRFVWRSCITLGSGTTLVCPMRSFSPNAVIAFMARTILALAPRYLMDAFVSHFHTQPLSINSLFTRLEAVLLNEKESPSPSVKDSDNIRGNDGHEANGLRRKKSQTQRLGQGRSNMKLTPVSPARCRKADHTPRSELRWSKSSGGW
jgi:hypothetical protein